MPWKSIVQSAIGTSHQRYNMPCQDYGGVRCLADGSMVVGAVADGAGSASHADIGAKVVVQTALESLSAIAPTWQAEPPTSETAQTWGRDLLNAVLTALAQHASQKDCQIHDLAATLLAFIATPQWLTALQIGDGFMVVRPVDGDYQLVFQPDKGEFANQTTFVTSTNVVDDMQLLVCSTPLAFICASTDALERVAIRLKDWTPFPPFFQPLDELLVETEQTDPINAAHDYLTAFLTSDRLNDRTDVEKTLLICRFIGDR